jgi:hypothetical protein
MDKSVLPAVFRLYEAEALGVVKEFYGADRHFIFPSIGKPGVGFLMLGAAM